MLFYLIDWEICITYKGFVRVSYQSSTGTIVDESLDVEQSPIRGMPLTTVVLDLIANRSGDWMTHQLLSSLEVLSLVVIDNVYELICTLTVCSIDSNPDFVPFLAGEDVHAINRYTPRMVLQLWRRRRESVRPTASLHSVCLPHLSACQIGKNLNNGWPC